jgi:hypothetical protein
MDQSRGVARVGHFGHSECHNGERAARIDRSEKSPGFGG